MCGAEATLTRLNRCLRVRSSPRDATTIISQTPERVGEFCAPQAVGFQVAAAAISIAGIPGAISYLARSSGIEVLPPCLLGLAIALALLHEFTVVGSSRRACIEPAAAIVSTD